jgi:dynactin complex subunit
VRTRNLVTIDEPMYAATLTPLNPSLNVENGIIKEQQVPLKNPLFSKLKPSQPSLHEHNTLLESKIEELTKRVEELEQKLMELLSHPLSKNN